MKAHLTSAVISVVVTVAGVEAREPRSAISPSAAHIAAQRVALVLQNQQPAGAPQSTPPAGADEAQLINIKIEITVSEQEGGTQPTRKTVALTLADRQGGSVRSTGVQRLDKEVGGGGPPRMNVDVFPMMRRDGRVQTQITLDYGQPGRGTSVRVEPLLESGKPLVVSQAVDPSSDRRTLVEVTATVLK